jgi:hypothetical protein
MLKTETNTPAMERRILRAFGRRRATAGFEHGQWWVSLPSGAQYSVVDAEGGDARDGFSFEQVSRGDE